MLSDNMKIKILILIALLLGGCGVKTNVFVPIIPAISNDKLEIVEEFDYDKLYQEQFDKYQKQLSEQINSKSEIKRYEVCRYMYYDALGANWCMATSECIVLGAKSDALKTIKDKCEQEFKGWQLRI